MPPFIEFFMRFPLVSKQIKAMAVVTSESMVKISQKIVSSILISLPERSEQERILNTLKVQQELISNFNSQLSKLPSLKTGLMQDLLSGKVRVNNLKKETL